MQEPTDAKIVDGLRTGDRDAWDALCEKYSARVWRYVGRMVGDPDGTADVYQETMLVVARSAQNVNDPSKLWSWLSSVCHNQAAFYWRKKYREPGANIDFTLIESTSFDTPEKAFERSETVTTVRWLLSEMTTEYATLLSAKYLDGKTVAEIVVDFGESAEAIRSRLARARKDFRKRYERLTSQVISDER